MDLDVDRLIGGIFLVSTGFLLFTVLSFYIFFFDFSPTRVLVKLGHIAVFLLLLFIKLAFFLCFAQSCV